MRKPRLLYEFIRKMEGDLITSDINPQIREKKENSSQPENVKYFLIKILEVEYDKIDESNVKLKDEYLKLINIYR